MYDYSGLVYITTPPVFAYRGGLYKSGGNDQDQVIAVHKTENLVMSFPSLLALCKYAHVNNLLGCTQFDNNDSGFIVPSPVSLVAEASSVGLARLVTLCGSGPVLSQLALKRSSEIHRGYYIVDKLPLLGNDFETGAVSGIGPTCATKRPKIGGSVCDRCSSA